MQGLASVNVSELSLAVENIPWCPCEFSVTPQRLRRAVWELRTLCVSHRQRALVSQTYACLIPESCPFCNVTVLPDKINFNSGL